MTRLVQRNPLEYVQCVMHPLIRGDPHVQLTRVVGASIVQPNRSREGRQQEHDHDQHAPYPPSHRTPIPREDEARQDHANRHRQDPEPQELLRLG